MEEPSWVLQKEPQTLPCPSALAKPLGKYLPYGVRLLRPDQAKALSAWFFCTTASQGLDIRCARGWAVALSFSCEGFSEAT